MKPAMKEKFLSQITKKSGPTFTVFELLSRLSLKQELDENELFIGREVILWRTGDYLLGIATPLSRHLNGFDLSIT